MTSPRSNEQVYVSTLPGLEPALEAEASALGWKPHRVEGGVELEGPAGLHQEANLHLRTASRVLLRVGTFRAGDSDTLAERLGTMDLSPLWDGRAPPKLSVSMHRSPVPGADVVFSAAAYAWGLPSVESAGPLDEEGGGPGLTLLVRVEGDTFTVSADTSGEPLHRRGYRQEVSRAPLRETLAAGILRLAGYDGAEPLVDPMCGSGTFLVEGAWMSMRRAPGLLRSFAFESFPGLTRRPWARARNGRRPRPALPSHGRSTATTSTRARWARRGAMPGARG
ncbi:class I SAM-dependent RNA methyltransferase [Pyxidicoccus sp. 3LG]